MLSRVIPASLAALFLAGCGKPSDNSSSAPASGPQAGQTANAGSAPEQRRLAGGSATTDPGTAPTGASSTAGLGSGASQAELAAALGELTQALRKYSFEHRRLPKTFSEVVAAGYVKDLPQAPPGKKFEIDPKSVQVVLVKQ
jgi:hypothetical protein